MDRLVLMPEDFTPPALPEYYAKPAKFGYFLKNSLLPPRNCLVVNWNGVESRRDRSRGSIIGTVVKMVDFSYKTAVVHS